MLILTIDSSTKVGSVALISEDKLIAESLLNLKLKHSPRLMPEIVSLLEKTGYSKEDLTGIGVALGPGSFTGTRIGVATAKSLAQSLEIPIVGISILEALAYNLKEVTGYICPMVDARRDRVFSVLYSGFSNQGQEFGPQSEESLIGIDDLVAELSAIEGKIYFVGQVVDKYKSKLKEEIKKPQFLANSFNLPRAGALADLALARLKSGNEDDLFAVTPNYLKQSQAEIQWEAKNK